MTTDTATSKVLDALRVRRDARAVAFQQKAERPLQSPTPYLLAASVLHVFDPASLRSAGTEDDGAHRDEVYDRSVPAIGWAGKRTLRLDVRLECLEQLGNREEILKALDANPQREKTSLQVVFESAVEGTIGDLARKSYLELGNLLQLYEWRLDRFVPMPLQREVREAYLRRARVSRFDHLVDASFTGREADLQVMRDHVGVVAPSAWSRMRAFFSSEARPPLFISGPGGAGKTALLGRFLIEHVEAPALGWFPFAYVAFDSDAVDVREPFTLLVEIGGQLAAQISRAADPVAQLTLEKALESYRRSVTYYRDERAKLGHRASIYKSQRDRLDVLKQKEDELCGSFARLLLSISVEAGRQQNAKTIPVLLVFDTFEEVIYRARHDLIGFWRTLAEISRSFPPLRIVIAGRAGPDAETAAREHVWEHSLKDLSQAESTSLLEKLGIAPAERALSIARQVGGNPLTLRLAARVGQGGQDAAGGLHGLETKRFGFLSISPALIRGQLYRRILDHIHDDHVRALAHPGMVLRRVTPDLIQEVLAPICKIADASAKSVALFEGLCKEHALVRLEGDGSLRYREEVRRPVLDLLQMDRPEEVRQIHQAAVDYYSRPANDRVEPVQRAEEIYHRLKLGQEAWQLDDRWLPGVESYLATSIEEIPPAQRIWLAQRMSIELPPEIYALADQEEWEKLTGPRVLHLLRYGELVAAANWLDDRKERSAASPLFALEARVLMGLGRYDEASQLLKRSLADYPTTGDRGRSSELLWLHAQSMSATERLDECVMALDRLVDLTASLSTPVPLVQALTERLRWSDFHTDRARIADLRERLSCALQALSPYQVDAERSLIRLALVRLGSGFPRTAERLLGEVFGEFAYMGLRGQVDLEAVSVAARESFTRSSVSEFQALASQDLGATPEMIEVLGSLLQGLPGFESASSLRLDSPALDGILQLLGAEKATLSGATLAGLVDSREDWESDAGAEVAA